MDPYPSPEPTMSTRTEEPSTAPRRRAGVRLNFGSVFVPVGLGSLGLMLLATRSMIRRQLPPGQRHLASLVLLAYLPRLGFYAFLLATVLSVLADLAVRLVVAPMIYRWLRPPEAADVFSTPVEFALASRERLVEQTPARRQNGRRWEPGRLVLTTLRLGFVPRGWDSETSWTPRSDLSQLALADPPRLGGRFVRGIPEVVAVVDRHGAEARYAVDDPEAVLGWFGAGREV